MILCKPVRIDILWEITGFRARVVLWQRRCSLFSWLSLSPLFTPNTPQRAHRLLLWQEVTETLIRDPLNSCLSDLQVKFCFLFHKHTCPKCWQVEQCHDCLPTFPCIATRSAARQPRNQTCPISLIPRPCWVSPQVRVRALRRNRWRPVHPPSRLLIWIHRASNS